MSIKNLELELKPYTTKELAAIYQVSDKTFNKWVGKFRIDVGEKSGRLYTIRKVTVIFDKLGLPGMVS